MNFKIIILVSFLAIGCGVKGDPVAPKSPKLPSLMENYPDIETERPVEDQRKLR